MKCEGSKMGVLIPIEPHGRLESENRGYFWPVTPIPDKMALGVCMLYHKRLSEVQGPCFYTSSDLSEKKSPPIKRRKSI